ncbi:MAG: hypothetical protein K5683_09360 [Prevotella sp.]|nr:hypothetical protein [Prevotella sp.]
MYQGITLIFRLIVLSSMFLSGTISMAQEDVGDMPYRVDDTATSTPFSAVDASIANESAVDADYRCDSLQLRMPQRFVYDMMPLNAYWPSPLTGGFGSWPLHKGLNASLSTAAIFGLGHHGGSGFGYGLSLAYAGSITPRLSYALGGYSQLLNYNGSQLRDAGVTALLDYRIDNHWETTAFVQKSLIEPRLPYQLYWLNDVGDKIGASLHYHFSPSLSIGISVWSQSQPYPPVR